jgi:hypothetical protein
VIEADRPRPTAKLVQLTYEPGKFFADGCSPRRPHSCLNRTYPLGTDGVAGTLYRLFRRQRRGVLSLRSRPRRATPAGRFASGDIVFAYWRSGLGRFTSALAHEVRIPAPAGEYAGDVIAETPAGDWLVAWRQQARNPFQLMWWKPGAGALRLGRS